MITELKYSNTNTYLVTGKKASLLFDTGWAGSFSALCKLLGEKKLRLRDIDYILISHFHPDHMGIAQQIANEADAVIVAADVQQGFIHSADYIFEREGNNAFTPIDDKKIKLLQIKESRSFLKELGINGELFHTPGHSDDSISLWLDKEKLLLVGDLNPLYELEMHKGSAIYESWQMLLKLSPKKVYYGHARPAELKKELFSESRSSSDDIYALVKKIIKLVDKGTPLEAVCKKTGADSVFVSDVIRMHFTHPGISVQGILDRIEIKGK